MEDEVGAWSVLSGLGSEPRSFAGVESDWILTPVDRLLTVEGCELERRWKGSAFAVIKGFIVTILVRGGDSSPQNLFISCDFWAHLFLFLIIF